MKPSFLFSSVTSFVGRAIAATCCMFVLTNLAFATAGTTYYSHGSTDPSNVSNWWTGTNGTGSHPADFTGNNDQFVIQNGDNMATTATWTLTGLSPIVEIQNGGTLTANNAVTLNNGDLTIDAGGSLVMNSDVHVGGNLALNSDVVTTGSNVLRVDGNVTNTTGYVIGNLAILVTGDVTFPVGTANGYSPISLSFPGGVTDNEPLKVSAVQAVEPNVISQDSVLARYWKLGALAPFSTPSFTGTVTVTLYYLAADFHDHVVEATDEATLVIGEYLTLSSSWYFPAGLTVTAGGTSDGGNIVSTNVNSVSVDLTIAKSVNAVLPVEMVTFRATSNRLSAQLNWSTATEVNNFGFEIERSYRNTEWTRVGFVPGAGTSNSLHNYSFVDENVQSGLYEYRIKQIDKDGAFKYSQTLQVEVGTVPKVLSLGSNYPNPFNPTTTIEFSVPSDGKATLKVYSILGQEVATLFDGNAIAGNLNKVTFDASRLSSGVYFSRLESGGKSLIKRMMLLK